MGKSYLLLMCLLTSTQLQQHANSLAPSLNAEQVLAGYERSISLMAEKTSFDAEAEQTFNGAFALKQKTVMLRRTLHRDRGRFGASVETEGYDGEHKLLWHNKTTSVVSDGEMMSYNATPGEPPRVLLIDSSPRTLELAPVLNVGPDRALDGITLGGDNKSFAEIMRQASSLRLRAEMEIVSGRPTYVLEAETKYGRHILWIDAEAGFNPRRVTIRKTVGDFYNAAKVGDPPDPSPSTVRPPYPWCAKVGTELTVDSIEIKKLGEAFVPVSARIVERIDYEDGQFTEEICTYKRTHVSFNLDFDAMKEAFLASIPDGTLVSFQDERGRTGVRYEWFGRRVRVRVDQSFLGELDGQIAQLGVKSRPRDVNNVESVPSEAPVSGSARPGAGNTPPGVLPGSYRSRVLGLVLVGVLLGGIVAGKRLLSRGGRHGDT